MYFLYLISVNSPEIITQTFKGIGAVKGKITRHYCDFRYDFHLAELTMAFDPISKTISHKIEDKTKELRVTILKMAERYLEEVRKQKEILSKATHSQERFVHFNNVMRRQDYLTVKDIERLNDLEKKLIKILQS